MVLHYLFLCSGSIKNILVMDSQSIINVWDINFKMIYHNTVLSIGKVPAYIGEKKSVSECLGE